MAILNEPRIQPSAAPPLPDTPGEHRFLLRNVSWQLYQTLVREMECGGTRLTFDRGNLELMSPHLPHESSKTLLGSFVEILCRELKMSIRRGGSTTFGREELQRGLEPDECYWIRHERLMRDKDEVDLARDPPPDLAIEVEITRSLVGRLPIYAALGVPELWRFDGRTLSILLLRDGQYVSSEASAAFPFMHAEDLLPLFNRDGRDEDAHITDCLDMVRRRIASKQQ